MDEFEELFGTTDVAGASAAELGEAMLYHGISFHECCVISPSRIQVIFNDIRDAETLMTLGVGESEGRRTLYDRSTASCVSLNAIGRSGNVDPDEIEAAVDAGWSWDIHPNMNGRRMDWHVGVSLSVADANQITANLNTLRHGGTL